MRHDAICVMQTAWRDGARGVKAERACCGHHPDLGVPLVLIANEHYRLGSTTFI